MSIFIICSTVFHTIFLLKLLQMQTLRLTLVCSAPNWAQTLDLAVCSDMVLYSEYIHICTVV